MGKTAKDLRYTDDIAEMKKELRDRVRNRNKRTIRPRDIYTHSDIHETDKADEYGEYFSE